MTLVVKNEEEVVQTAITMCSILDHDIPKLSAFHYLSGYDDSISGIVYYSLIYSELRNESRNFALHHAYDPYHHY